MNSIKLCPAIGISSSQTVSRKALAAGYVQSPAASALPLTNCGIEPGVIQKSAAAGTPGLLCFASIIVIGLALSGGPLFAQDVPEDARPNLEDVGGAVEAAPAEALEVVEEAIAAEEKPEKEPNRKARAAAVAAGAAEEVGVAIGEIAEGLLEGIFGGRGRQAPRFEAVMEAQVNDNAIKQFEQQYGRHFDQYLKTELHFIRLVCNPTRKQFEAVASDGKKVRADALKHFAGIQQGWNRGVNMNNNNSNDPRAPIVDGLLNSVKVHFKPEQTAAYQQELNARNLAYRQMVVASTAMKVDAKLKLNPDQRQKVVAALTDGWDHSQVSMQSLMYGGSYFPDLPDRKLKPIFTEKQKKVWQNITQQSQVFWGFNIGMNQAVVLEDEEWPEEPEGVVEQPVENLKEVNPDQKDEESGNE